MCNALTLPHSVRTWKACSTCPVEGSVFPSLMISCTLSAMAMPLTRNRSPAVARDGDGQMCASTNGVAVKVGPGSEHLVKSFLISLVRMWDVHTAPRRQAPEPTSGSFTCKGAPSPCTLSQFKVLYMLIVYTGTGSGTFRGSYQLEIVPSVKDAGTPVQTSPPRKSRF